MDRKDAIPILIDQAHTLPIVGADKRRGTYATPAGAPEFDLGAASDRGRERDRNEDFFAMAELSRWLRIHEVCGARAGDVPMTGAGQGLVIAVADGIGGHGGGDVASAVALDAFLQYVLYALPWYATVGGEEHQAMLQQLRVSVEVAHEQVVRVAERKHIGCQSPGTTLTAAYITWPIMYLLHVGDSRCYLFRDERLMRLTRDQTLAQDLMDRGVAGDVINQHFHHVLSNAIGAGKEALEPEIHRVELRGNDDVLLCTDGLFGEVEDEVIAAILARGASASDACAELISVSNEAGGRDNVTAVLARC